METVSDAKAKVNEAIEILAALARSGTLTQEAVREVDDLCNDLSDQDEIFDYISGIVPLDVR